MHSEVLTDEFTTTISRMLRFLDLKIVVYLVGFAVSRFSSLLTALSGASPTIVCLQSVDVPFQNVVGIIIFQSNDTALYTNITE